MPTIHLTTFIAAPTEVVFDLARNIELHKESLPGLKEEFAGKRDTLIRKDETITWKAKRFLKTRILQIRITEMKKNEMFKNEQARGDFRMMEHEQYFKTCDNGTIVIDLFHFESPYGLIGRWFNSLFLTRYMKQMLEKRNHTIKSYAESDKWRKLLAH